uniref:Uncharacterized protein n=1 Tax=Haptolina brevifila TaxID=156173 RepID=A0A7S2HA10_9EUKA
MARLPTVSLLLLLVIAWCSARPKTSRDWSKLSDKDWERIESEWETPEEKEEYEFKMPEKKGIDLEQVQKLMKKKGKKNQAKAQQLIQESQQSAGPTMMFATLDYPDCCDKKETETIASRWRSMLMSSGMDVTTYIIEDDQVLFSTQAGLHAAEIRDFVLKQPECVAVEWNSKREPGPAETPEWKAKDEVKKAEKKAREDAKKAEEAAVKAAEEKLKKKRRAAKRKRQAGSSKEEL